ncbi:hypothetical protein [Allorhizocola rhizosphaerae]|uniref:hypothetical protein n=1 Tax=Allorhizocola rhizosphaerae TaxID=1872709 RepID=UPI000E3D8A6B|nr:hypothetical protein [Allorhizocola rhizosphaerae]
MSKHRWFAVLVLVGLLLRGLVMLAYQPALWYDGDSGAYLNLAKVPLTVDPTRALGYVMVLKLLQPTRTLFAVALVQHLAGVAIAVGVYAFLLWRGVAKGPATVAAGVLLFDSLLITLEHYVLSELVFMPLLVACVLALMLPERLGWMAAGACGLLLFVAWFVRPVAVPLAGLLLVYLLLRRVGWRPVLAFVAAFAVPYVGFMTFVVGDQPSAYGSYWSARSLFGRVAPIADCARLELTPQQRALCPAEPLGRRSARGDWYVWNGPASSLEPPVDAEVMNGFAMEVIRRQPMDYLRVVGREAAQHFVPLPDRDPGYWCLRQRYWLPVTASDEPAAPSHCRPELAGPGYQAAPSPSSANPPGNGLTVALNAYSRWARVPVLAVLAVFLLTAFAALRRPFLRVPATRDAVLCVAIAAVLTVGPVFVSMYEPRYAAPALPFVCIAGALVWQRLRYGDNGSPGSARP